MFVQQISLINLLGLGLFNGFYTINAVDMLLFYISSDFLIEHYYYVAFQNVTVATSMRIITATYILLTFVVFNMFT